MQILLVLAIGAAFAWYELPALAKNNWKRERFVFLLFLIAAETLIILHMLRVNIISPTTVVLAVFKPIAKLIFEF